MLASYDKCSLSYIHTYSFLFRRVEYNNKSAYSLKIICVLRDEVLVCGCCWRICGVWREFYLSLLYYRDIEVIIRFIFFFFKSNPKRDVDRSLVYFSFFLFICVFCNSYECLLYCKVFSSLLVGVVIPDWKDLIYFYCVY